MDPKGEAGQLDRQGVQVHPVHATPGDLATKELRILKFNAIGQWPKGLEGTGPQACQLIGNGRQRPHCQVGGEAPLHPVHRGHQEVAGAHGNIRHPEVKEGLPRFMLREHVQPCDVFVQCGLQGVVQQVLYGKGLGEVRAGCFPRPRAVV